MIACPHCHAVLPGQMVNSGGLQRCPECLTKVRADLFNAFCRPLGQSATGEPVQVQGQAECFYHPGKKAVVPCAACGRLLCSLCEVPFDGHSLCMGCLQAGRNKRRIQNLENSRFLYDSLALYLALGPLVFLFITPITAPAAIYVALRYWKAPASLVPRTRYRFVLALLVAIAQLAGWGFFLVWFLSR
jgi:hypothetical protein